MMKNIYIAIQIKENEKYYAYVLKTTDNNNLISVLDIKGIMTANVWSKKVCEKAVECWNENFKKNGTNMY